MIPVVFFSHAQEQCGVYQFGKQIHEALRASQKYDVIFCKVEFGADLREAVAKHHPKAIIVNWHPATQLRWIRGWPLWSLGVPVIGLMHEMSDVVADGKDNTEFDYYIFHDPSAKTSNPVFFRAGRLIQHFKSEAPPPSRPTIGSFGFAGSWKNYEGLVARAHAEFDDCLIRLHMPAGFYCDADGSEAHKVAERCRSIISKPGVDFR